MTRYEVCHFRKSIHNHKDAIPKTKSIEISSQGTLGTGRGMYKPCGLSRDLAFWHVMHRAMKCSTSRLIFAQKKWLASMSSVFFTPKCPVSPPPCASCSNNKRMELAGMHSLLARNTKPPSRANLFHLFPSLQFNNTSFKSTSCSYCPLIICSPKFLKSSW